MKCFYSINLDTQMGADIGDAIKEAIDLATYTRDSVSFTFNGYNMRVTEGTDIDDVYREYIKGRA